MTSISDTSTIGAVTDPDQPIPQTEGDGDVNESSRRKKLFLAFLLLVLGILLLFSAWYLLFRKPIGELPLPGVPNTTVPTYASVMYGMKQPAGVAVTPSGDRIYVAETQGERALLVLDASGKVIAKAGPPGAAQTARVPVYVAVDPVTSEVYASDRWAGAVFVYDRDGKYLRQFQPDASITEWAPLGVGFDAKGDLFVGDVAVGTNVVYEFDPTGKLLQTIGAGQNMSYPNGIAVDAGGHVFIADGSNGRVLVFDTSGARLSIVSRGVADGQLGMPRGIAIDDHGRLVVVDTTSHQVRFYTIDPPSGALTYVNSVGTEGRQDAGFEFPTGVAADSRGRIYVADTQNDRLQVWSY